MRVTSETILSGPMIPTLARMTWPMVLSIFAMMLFGAVDTFYISLLGTEELAAVSFTFPITFLVMNLTIGLSVATSVIMARLIGRKEHILARRTCSDSMLFSCVLVILIAGLGIVTIDPLFIALGATEATLPFIRDYMWVWYGAVVLLVLPMIGNGAIRATGDTQWPSVIMMVSGVVNAVLDPLLIFGWGPFPRLEVSGAAYATAISWLLSFVAGIWILKVREDLLTFEPPDLTQLVQNWRALIRIGTPISIANMLTPVTAGALVAVVARYGEASVAAFGIGSRIEVFALIVTLALTATLSPYLAQNFGAGQVDRARRALRLILGFVVVLQGVFALFLALFAEPLARIFTDDAALISITKHYLWIMPVGLCFQAAMLICNTTFNAGQHSQYSLITSGSRFATTLICALIGAFFWGLLGVFVGATLGSLFPAILGLCILKRRWRSISRP